MHMNEIQTYYLRIADNSLILGHQLGAYCSYAPFIEEDLAIANTSLDLIGQAESIYAEIEKQTAGVHSERTLVYQRSAAEFSNFLLFEQENTDFAYIMARQFFADNYNYHLYSALSKSKDSFLFAFANKSLKEVTYHLKRSSEWMIRLGEGTEEAHLKTQKAIDDLYPFVDEMFQMSEGDYSLYRKGVSVDLEEIKTLWLGQLREIFFIAGFNTPSEYAKKTVALHGHSGGFQKIVDDMQQLHKQIPEAVWL